MAERNFDASYQAAWIPQKIPTLIISGDQDHLTPLSLFLEKDGFQNKNIIFQEINNAGHYPWIDNPDKIKEVFLNYLNNTD